MRPRSYAILRAHGYHVPDPRARRDLLKSGRKLVERGRCRLVERKVGIDERRCEPLFLPLQLGFLVGHSRRALRYLPLEEDTEEPVLGSSQAPLSCVQIFAGDRDRLTQRGALVESLPDQVLEALQAAACNLGDRRALDSRSSFCRAEGRDCGQEWSLPRQLGMGCRTAAAETVPQRNAGARDA